MAKNINLIKLKDEIENRKAEKNMVSSKLGESVGRNIAPRDAFLNGLLESLHSGKETSSTALVKTVDNTVATKKGEAAKLPISNVPQVPQGQQRINEVNMSSERDEQLFADLERKRKQTIAESMQQYINPANAGVFTTNQYMNMPKQMNEGHLIENVEKIVDNYLVGNFGPVVEEAIKSTIIEMFAVERIKEVLHENKDLIRTVVIETIKEIQAKNKAKSQS